MKAIKLPSYWSLVLRFSTIFVLVVIVIELIFELIKAGNLNAVSESFNDFTWLKYLAIKLIIGFAYGLFMARITRNRLKKQKMG